MAQPKTILIVDDDDDLRGALAEQIDSEDDLRATEASTGEAGVFLNEERAWQGVLGINPIALRDGDERIVAERLQRVLAAAPAFAGSLTRR